MIGVSRETVTRLLVEMKKRQIVGVERLDSSNSQPGRPAQDGEPQLDRSSVTNRPVGRSHTGV